MSSAEALASQRIHERLPVDLPVEFRTSNGSRIEARVLNVSKSGMYIETPKILENGNRLFFRVQLKSQPLQFHLEGEVIWAKKARKAKEKSSQGMGIRFLVSPTQTEKTLSGIFSVLNSSGR